jgi:dTDP-4-amino-4,6-dideoxygalactose transaminase
MTIARAYGLRVVEDAAQGVNSWYNGRALGSIGDLGCYSFHETKNVICGEGGALCINAPELIERAEIIRDKGTNRQRFFRGEVDKYTWVDVGSSYVPSEICSAFLCGQLEEIDRITQRRQQIHLRYLEALKPLEHQGFLQLPCVPDDCVSNHHLFFVVLPTPELRDGLLDRFRASGIRAVFHYIPLHNSPFGSQLCGPTRLPNTEDLSARLIRLPVFNDITTCEIDTVIASIQAAANNWSSRLSADSPDDSLPVAI